MTTTDAPLYTQAERKKFNEYCEALAFLADLTLPEGFSGVVSRGGRCECTRRVPSGIPAQFERTIYEFCPACVTAKDSVGGIRQKLDALVAEDAGPGVLFAPREATTTPAPPTPTEAVDALASARELARQLASGSPPPPPPTTTTTEPMPEGLTATINRLERRLASATSQAERERIERMLEAARAAGEA